jgi:four helix bundle protein
MGTISRFQDLEAWQDARALVRRIYVYTSGGDFSRDFGLRDQVQRAAVSIMANIAEGFERKNRKELNYHLRIARASCSEVQSHLYVALDVGFINEQEFKELEAQAVKVGSKISGFQRYFMQDGEPK